MLDAYVRPFFEGFSYGYAPVQLAEGDNRSTFALAAAVSVVGFSAIPMTLSTRLCSAAAFGGMAFMSYRIKCVREHQRDIISTLNQAFSLIEILYQGKVIHPLSKLFGVAACRASNSLKKQGKEEDDENIRYVAAICIGSYGTMVAVEKGLPLGEWFLSVGWETKLVVVTGTIALSIFGLEAYDKWFANSEKEPSISLGSFKPVPDPVTPKRKRGCYQ